MYLIDTNVLGEHGESATLLSVRDTSERQQLETLLEIQNQVLKMIAIGTPLMATLTTLVSNIEAQSPGMLGSILLLDEEGFHVRHGAAPSLPSEFVAAINGQPIGPGAGSCGTAMYRNEAVFVEDIEVDPLWVNYRAAALPHGLRACWSMPICDENRRVLGSFAMYYRAPGLPKPEHLKLIETTTHLAAIAIGRQHSETSLRQSESRLRNIIDGLGPSMFVGLLTIDGVVLEANQQALEAANLTLIDVLGKALEETYWFAYSEESKQQIRATIDRAARGEASRYDLLIRVAENQFIPLDFSLQPFRDATGSVVLLVPSAIVIIERKQAEDALRRSEAKFRAIIDSSPVAIAMNDEHGNVTLLNHKFIETFGYSLSDIPTVDDWWRLAYPDPAYRHSVAQKWQAALERMRQGNVDLGPMEYKVTGKDGSVRDISFSMTPFGASSLVVLYDFTEHKRLAEERDRLFNSSLDMFCVAGFDGYFKQLNPAWPATLGWELTELQSTPWIDLVHPDDRVATLRVGEQLVHGHPVRSFENRYRCKDASYRWLSWNCDPIVEAETIFAVVRDVTGSKQAEADVRKLSLAVEQSPNSIVITDLDAIIEYVNESFVELTGFSRHEVIGTYLSILQSGSTPKAVYDDMWMHLHRGESWRGELRNTRKDGGDYIGSVRISPVRQEGGRITHYLAIEEDISAKKIAEARIEKLAHFDQLTGLPNRSLLSDRFTYALSLAQRSGQPLAVMFLDLDHFKHINDTLGHTFGDRMLMEVAIRIRATLRQEDTVSRQGGDEFILLLHDTDADGAATVAAKLIAAISQPCVLDQHELVTTPSIGIAIYPHDGDDFETLSKNADAAMYRVKRDGRNNVRFYTPEMQAHSARSLQLANSLRHALQRNELHLHYQPQLCLVDGHIIGVEALLRWRHPTLGDISPAEFIPIAENGGQIIQIGAWVLRTASEQLKRWLDGGMPAMVMAVNLSSVQFRQANVADIVMHILDDVQLEPKYLELELTEAVAMGDPVAAIEVMNKLYECGIRMSIDDFGTGYSSLSYLKKFRVSKLKIDQSFVRDINVDPDDKVIVSAIINMARSLGIQTIAEGVETAEQLAYLRLQGCDQAQGYHFSRPLPAEQFEAYVKKSRRLCAL